MIAIIVGADAEDIEVTFSKWNYGCVRLAF